MKHITKTLFNKHLVESGMDYFQHLLHTWKMIGILIVHGFFPWIWETKVSGIINGCEK